MEFFQRVIDRKDRNKMTLNNVAVVMAPNIFMCKGFRSKISEQQEFAMATGTANIVRLLVRYRNLLWTVRPPAAFSVLVRLDAQSLFLCLRFPSSS